MRARIPPGRCHSIVLCAIACLFCDSGTARAEDASSWRDIETKYIFGFTTGSGIGLEGEKEFTVDSIGRFGKRDGHYAATETKYEFEFTPTQFIQIEFGALGATHHIGGVTDLDDRRQVALSGAFAEFRYLAIERTSNNPLAVTLAFEPTGALPLAAFLAGTPVTTRRAGRPSAAGTASSRRRNGTVARPRFSSRSVTCTRVWG